MRRPGSPGINALLTAAFARSASSVRKPLKDQPSAFGSLVVLAQARRPPSWQPDLPEPIAGVGQTAFRAQDEPLGERHGPNGVQERGERPDSPPFWAAASKNRDHRSRVTSNTLPPMAPPSQMNWKNLTTRHSRAAAHGRLQLKDSNVAGQTRPCGRHVATRCFTKPSPLLDASE